LRGSTLAAYDPKRNNELVFHNYAVTLSLTVIYWHEISTRFSVINSLMANYMKNFTNLVLSFILLLSVSFSLEAASASVNQSDSSSEVYTLRDSRYTFVIVHGASGGGWDWKTMDELLTARGHIVYRPTLTGLGEKMHLNSPEIDLTTHVTDIVNVVLFEDLSEVILVGHSYGGMVITGVMNRIPQRISHAVFLDAAVPDDGTSAMDLWPAITSDHDVVDGIVHFSWLDPTSPVPGDVPQSLKTLTEPVSFNNPEALNISATFIAFIAEEQTVEARAADPSWQNAKARDWTIHTLDSDHNAQRSHPEELAALLEAAPAN
jgi:pimeloyl-ACP methyl ester carboxylesterase